MLLAHAHKSRASLLHKRDRSTQRGKERVDILHCHKMTAKSAQKELQTAQAAFAPSVAGPDPLHQRRFMISSETDSSRRWTQMKHANHEYEKQSLQKNTPHPLSAELARPPVRPHAQRTKQWNQSPLPPVKTRRKRPKRKKTEATTRACAK